uniref:Uncharacterized protein n=1 Tax=Caenorhabditis tropicalis TaxID=1561998 RepID=A0A1I7UUA1_9PELO
MVVPRRSPVRQQTFILFLLETIARVILHDESHRHLPEEEYINWFLHRVFTLESFVEIIAFSIVCFWSGGGLLFFSIIFCHVFLGFVKLQW